MFDKLFSPIVIRGTELKNRIIMPAMGTHMPGNDSSVTDELIGYHAARAKGGCGLNIVECCSVNRDSSPAKHAAISDDSFIPGHRKLTDAVHAAGGKCALQLWQGGTAAGVDPRCRIFLPDGYSGKQGSVFVIPGSRTEKDGTIPPVSAEELKMLAEDFGRAAKRAVLAGYDAVEFHCGHNYLPHNMLSKAFNHRTDEYGGSPENRMRFPLDCIRKIRENIPETMPLFMRISVVDEPELDGGKGGNTLEDSIAFCKAARKAGVDVADVSRGNFSSLFGTCYEVPPVDLPCGFNADNAARIRWATGLITMAVGRINTPQLAEELLAKGKADLIGMGRAQLADAEFCNKAKEGRLSAIRYCIGCTQGCYDYFVNPDKAHISCMRNPAVGCEAEKELRKTANPKRVLIAGGGIAGLELADDLFRRGHHPILCESTDRLGGQFLLAGAAPRKADFAMAVKMAVKNAEESGIEIRMNTPVTPALVKQEKPDAVVIAVGSEPVIPRIPGADGGNVFDSHSVLGGEALPEGKVVIIGAGLVGIETAEYLSAKKRDVVIVEMKNSILDDMGALRQTWTRRAIMQEDIRITLNAACREIRDDCVIVERNGKQEQIPAGAVVMAVGCKSRPWRDIQDICTELKIPCRVIGDALKAPGQALDAIREAYDTALSI